MSIRCDNCGAFADGDEVPLSWVTSLENGQARRYCERCARANVRAIEARLDPVWW
jgi:hypothetical protein